MRGAQAVVRGGTAPCPPRNDGTGSTPPIKMPSMIKILKQNLLFFSFTCFYHFLQKCTRSTVTNNDIDMDDGWARASSIQNFADKFKCIARVKSRVVS